MESLRKSSMLVFVAKDSVNRDSRKKKNKKWVLWKERDIKGRLKTRLDKTVRKRTNPVERRVFRHLNSFLTITRSLEPFVDTARSFDCSYNTNVIICLLTKGIGKSCSILAISTTYGGL